MARTVEISRLPDQNPNPVMLVNAADGRVTYANAASAPLRGAWNVEVGDAVTPTVLSDLRAAADSDPPVSLEVTFDLRTIAVLAVWGEAREAIAAYGTDVTARKSIERFPDRNPNPVLRITSEGTLRYANRASASIVEALGLQVSASLPAELWDQVEQALVTHDTAPLEVSAGDLIYELTVVAVPEFDFVNLYGTDVTAARLVEQANRENERLLLNILPPSIAARLRGGEMVIADRFEEITVLFADVVDFTPLSAQMNASDLVALLNEVFSVCDRLVDRYGLEKIKTIGDAYMVVGGIGPEGADHPERVASMALDMIDALGQMSSTGGTPLRIRVGLHIGPAVAGVIGIKKFIYDVWGDTVNTASRLESTGEPSRIQVLESTARRLAAHFRFERRGGVDLKGKGRVETWFLVGRIGAANEKAAELGDLTRR